MKLGAEPRKMMILGGLLAVAAVVYFMNSSSGDTGGYTPRTTTTPAPAATATRTSPPGQPPRATPAAKPNRGQRQMTEFRPSLKPKRGEDRPDPMSIDPTLRLDLLAKLQTIDVQGSHRSIFDFGVAPPPKQDPKVEAAKAKVPSPIVPVQPDAAKKVEASKPQAPPIPLKFFGYVTPAGQMQKRAFFVDGEDIHVVYEGDIVKRRYKVVRIGVNSAVVEDTQFGSQQTLPLEEQPS